MAISTVPILIERDQLGIKTIIPKVHKEVPEECLLVTILQIILLGSLIVIVEYQPPRMCFDIMYHETSLA